MKKLFFIILIFIPNLLFADNHFTNEDLTGKEILCGKVIVDLETNKINYFYAKGFEFISENEVQTYYKNTLDEEFVNLYLYKTSVQEIFLENTDKINNLGYVVDRKTLSMKIDVTFEAITFHEGECHILDKGDIKLKVEELIQSFNKYMESINII